MGDCLRVGKLSHYVTSHPGQLSLAMQKALRETQTLRAGCSKVEPKKFAPAADPLRGGAGRPTFNQLEMVTTFTSVGRRNEWRWLRPPLGKKTASSA